MKELVVVGTDFNQGRDLTSADLFRGMPSVHIDAVVKHPSIDKFIYVFTGTELSVITIYMNSNEILMPP